MRAGRVSRRSESGAAAGSGSLSRASRAAWLSPVRTTSCHTGHWLLAAPRVCFLTRSVRTRVRGVGGGRRGRCLFRAVRRPLCRRTRGVTRRRVSGALVSHRLCFGAFSYLLVDIVFLRLKVCGFCSSFGPQATRHSDASEGAGSSETAGFWVPRSLLIRTA